MPLYNNKPKITKSPISDNVLLSETAHAVKSIIETLKKKEKRIKYSTDNHIKKLKEYRTKLESIKLRDSKNIKVLNLIELIQKTLNFYNHNPNGYGHYSLPMRGIVNSFTDGTRRATHYLKYPSSANMKKYNCNIVNVPVNLHSFGKITWYPAIDIDNTYSTYSGGYSYPNGGLGPYSAVGLGNYPRKMFAEVNKLNLN